MDVSKEKLIQWLKDSGCIKRGYFTLKSGLTSDYYIDLRFMTMHHISLYTGIVKLLKDIIKGIQWENLGRMQKTAVVGVPYGVVPLAAMAAYAALTSYYPVRKETKDYGNMESPVEFESHKFILVEDVMSTGSSIIDTIKKLDSKQITDVIVIVDRELGGEEKLKSEFPDIRFQSIFKVSDFINVKKVPDEEDE